MSGAMSGERGGSKDSRTVSDPAESATTCVTGGGGGSNDCRMVSAPACSEMTSTSADLRADARGETGGGGGRAGLEGLGG